MTTDLTVSNIVLVAKRQEIEALGRLASNAQFAGVLGHLIHALQNERGASSIYLASAGVRFAATRQDLIIESAQAEHAIRTFFAARLNDPTYANAKLFSLMAWVLLGLDTLPEVREQIAGHRMTADMAIAAFSRLIAGMVSLIFEVADTAIDPDISRQLVALFHLIQAKEYAGQERAVGALSFASGKCDGQNQQRVLHLIDAQERNFQVFLEFAQPQPAEAWQQLQLAPCTARLERLRRILCSARAGAALDADNSDRWFECCTERLNALWQLQQQLVGTLRERCTGLIVAAQRDLLDVEGLLKGVRDNPPSSANLVDRFFDSAASLGLQPIPLEGGAAHVRQSIVEILQVQSARLAGMEAELEAARRALKERKTIERAKGVLMARFNLTEQAAYQMLRKTSMEQNRRIADVADATVAVLASIGAVDGTA